MPEQSSEVERRALNPGREKFNTQTQEPSVLLLTSSNVDPGNELDQTAIRVESFQSLSH